MRKLLFTLAVVAIPLLGACAGSGGASAPSPAWVPGSDIEAFWLEYSDARGGLTWGTGTEYPLYSQVEEGDTFLVQLSQGPCLMEFFHSRWRRANDVRRWDETMNDFGGCPYVFD